MSIPFGEAELTSAWAIVNDSSTGGGGGLWRRDPIDGLWSSSRCDIRPVQDAALNKDRDTGVNVLRRSQAGPAALKDVAAREPGRKDSSQQLCIDQPCGQLADIVGSNKSGDAFERDPFAQISDSAALASPRSLMGVTDHAQDSQCRRRIVLNRKAIRAGIS